VYLDAQSSIGKDTSGRDERKERKFLTESAEGRGAHKYTAKFAEKKGWTVEWIGVDTGTVHYALCTVPTMHRTNELMDWGGHRLSVVQESQHPVQHTRPDADPFRW
jgi:hypothetical protein